MSNFQTKGFVKFTDFDFCKLLEDQKDKTLERAHTMVGLPFYWAPEMISGNGYGFLADIWALGICIYELVTGVLPFGGDEDDTYELMEKIKKNKLTFPTFMLRDDKFSRMKSFLEMILQKNPQDRLGLKSTNNPGPRVGDYSSLKAHYWFTDFHFVRKYTLD